MKIYSYLILSVLIALFVSSCHKIEQLPARPHIEFRSFAVFDTTALDNYIKGGRLNFYFEDGDGDLGINPDNVTGPDTVNLFFTLYRKSGNSFAEVPGSDLLDPSDYRIPYMERTGQNKILIGIISITFLYLNYSPAATDTLKYEFWIKDRALNVSDTVITCEIPLSVNGLYQ